MPADSTVTVPLPNAERIKAQISELADALSTRAPGYESLLQTIHKNLAEDPDTQHFLTDEEIGVIVAGLTKKTGLMIAEEAVKKAGRKGGKIDLGDL